MRQKTRGLSLRARLGAEVKAVGRDGTNQRHDRCAVLFLRYAEGSTEADENLVLLEVDADAVDDPGEVLDTAVGDDLGEELGDVEIGGRRQGEEDVAWEGAR